MYSKKKGNKDMALSPNDIVKVKKMIDENLLEQKEEEKNFLRLIYEKFSIYGLVLVLIFGLLDYFTFVDSFHFSSALFLKAYVFNTSLFDSTLLWIIIFFPILLMSLLVVMPYLAITLAVRIMQKKELKTTHLFGNFAAFRLSVIFNFIFITVSIVGFYVIDWRLGKFEPTDIWIYLLFICVPFFVSYLPVIPYLKKRDDVKENQDLFMLFPLWNTSVFVALSILLWGIGEWSGWQNFKFLVVVIAFLMIIPLIVSFQIVDFKTNHLSKPSPKLSPMLWSSIFIASMITITGYLYNANKEVWADNNLSKRTMSFNIFLNKYFLCPTDKVIDINLSNVIVPKTVEMCKSDLKTRLGQDSFYLPISKESALYFDNKNENNQTIIYAINEKDNKSEVLAIGYLSNCTK